MLSLVPQAYYWPTQVTFHYRFIYGFVQGYGHLGLLIELSKVCSILYRLLYVLQLQHIHLSIFTYRKFII